MPGTGGGFGSSAPMSNNVTPSPDLKWLQDQYKSRLSADTTGRAVDRASSQIRDATSGLSKELGGNMARRGMSGSGAYFQGQGNLAGQAQKAIAGASADIHLGRERDLDNLTMGGLGIMGSQDQLGLQKQRFGLDQWNSQAANDLARGRLGLDQWNAQGQMGLAQQQAALQGQQALWSIWNNFQNSFR
jgi:hypothetical protein